MKRVETPDIPVAVTVLLLSSAFVGCGGATWSQFPPATLAAPPLTEQPLQATEPVSPPPRPARARAAHVEKASCPNDSVQIGTFCIDKFEAPNREGALPIAYQDAIDAQLWCEARSKRLCTEREWVRACKGKKKKRFSYGARHKRDVCNDGARWRSPEWALLGAFPKLRGLGEAARLYHAVPSGSMPRCKSDEGVFDMLGNVAEWTSRDQVNKVGYEHVVRGCYWAGCFKEPEPNCDFRNGVHPSGFRSYEFGFRCCMDAATTPEVVSRR